MKRRNAVVVLVATVVVASAGGWIAASHIRSPAEEAARTAEPDASPILVPAEERVVASEVVTRGTARFGTPQQLTLLPAALKSGPGVVSSIPVAGTEVNEGDVVLTASGRPVFLLQGGQPMFRDLGPGLEGDDVRQLQEALQRLGFDPGAVDGRFTSRTEAAIRSWYEAAGFAPFVTTDEQLAAIRALEAELATARTEVLGADDGVASADAALAAARATESSATATAAAGAAGLQAADAQARADDEAAASEVATRKAALDALLAPPPDATPTAGEIAVARAEMATAQAQATSTHIAGRRLVAEAYATAVTATSEVASADAALRAAEIVRANATGAVDARRTVESVTSIDLDLVRRRAGVQVPADEVVFVRAAPVRVAEVTAGIGTELTGAVMSVTDAIVAIDGSLPLADAPLVTAGMPVTIDEPDLGIEATGVVTRVAETPGTNGVDGFHIYFEILVDGSPPNIVGASVRLSVPVESTGGAVLAVPISAVSLAPDGSSRVQRDSNGTLEFVTVKPGLSADGFVEVTPTAGALRAGDLVVVGIDQRAPGDQGPSTSGA